MSGTEVMTAVFTAILVGEFIVFVLLLDDRVRGAFEQIFETLTDILSRPIVWAQRIFLRRRPR